MCGGGPPRAVRPATVDAPNPQSMLAALKQVLDVYGAIQANPRYTNSPYYAGLEPFFKLMEQKMSHVEAWSTDTQHGGRGVASVVAGQP
jgi:hypothetical protein